MKKRRLLSIVLSLCMVLALMPAAAYAKMIIESVTTITEGTFTDDVENKGTINGGVFNGTVDNLPGRINNGTFNGKVVNAVGGTIHGGTFSGSSNVQNDSEGTIYAGTFDVKVNNNGGEIRGGTFNAEVYNGTGKILGGTFYDTVDNESGQIWGGTFYDTVDNENGGIAGGTFYGGISDYGRVEGTCHTVSFDLNGGSGAVPTQYFVGIDTAKALKPATNPTKKGYSFEGWYTDEALNNLYDFESEVIDNITLYAGWEEIITLTMPFTTTVELGGNVAPGETTFNLEVVSPSGDKLSSDDVEIKAESVTTNGAKSYDGTLSITGTSEDIANMLRGKVFVKQAEGKYPDWVVDDTVWCLVWKDEIVALDADDTALGDTILIYPTGFEESEDGDRYYYPDLNKKPVDQMSFTNTYTKTAVKPASDNSSDTGDSTNLPLLIGLMLLSIAGITGVTGYRRRKRIDE